MGLKRTIHGALLLALALAPLAPLLQPGTAVIRDAPGMTAVQLQLSEPAEQHRPLPGTGSPAIAALALALALACPLRPSARRAPLPPGPAKRRLALYQRWQLEGG